MVTRSQLIRTFVEIIILYTGHYERELNPDFIT